MPYSIFLENEAAKGEVFSDTFDSSFYLSKYSDVSDAGLPPFYHYVAWGEKEGRVISSKNKNDLVEVLRRNPFFDSSLYIRNQQNIDIDVHEHAVLYGGEFKLSEDVDVEFVKNIHAHYT